MQIDMPPLCDEEEFAEMVANMVADQAPRLFAIVAEYGDRVDAMCAAWGFAFDDRAYAVGIHGNRYHSAAAPEAMLRRFRVGSITPRLVWFDPSAATPPTTED